MPKENEKRKWSKENIVAEIQKHAVDGFCKRNNPALATVACRMFGSWEEACHMGGLKSHKERQTFETCCIDGCDRPTRSGRCQWCEKHYYRNRRNGNPEKLLLKQYTINHDIVDIWTDKLAWLIGYICTDGHVSRNSISFVSKDHQLIEVVQKVLSTNATVHLCYNKYQRFSISSKKIANFLYQIGLTENKTFSLTVPSIPHALFPSFLRGVIDGDGWVTLKAYRKKQQSKDCHVGIVSGSQFFIERLADELRSRNITCSNRIEIPRRTDWHPKYKLVIYEQKSIRTLVELMYPADVPCLYRKRDLLMEFYNSPRGKAGNPDLRARRTDRTCPICENVFSTTERGKMCCSRPCGRKQAWITRKKRAGQR